MIKYLISSIVIFLYIGILVSLFFVILIPINPYEWSLNQQLAQKKSEDAVLVLILLLIIAGLLSLLSIVYTFLYFKWYKHYKKLYIVPIITLFILLLKSIQLCIL